VRNVVTHISVLRPEPPHGIHRDFREGWTEFPGRRRVRDWQPRSPDDLALPVDLVDLTVLGPGHGESPVGAPVEASLVSDPDLGLHPPATAH
jgi:hypothetical protein